MERQEEPVTTKQTRLLSNGPFKFIRPLWHFEVRKEWERKERVCEREPSWKAIYHYLLFVVGVGNKNSIYLLGAEFHVQSLAAATASDILEPNCLKHLHQKNSFFWKPIENSTKIKQGCFDFNADDFYRAENFGEKIREQLFCSRWSSNGPKGESDTLEADSINSSLRLKKALGWKQKEEGEREVGGVGAVEISVAHNRSPTDWQNLFGTGFLGLHESHSSLWMWLFLNWACLGLFLDLFSFF